MFLFFGLTCFSSSCQSLVNDSLYEIGKSSYVSKIFDQISVKLDLDSEMEGFIIKGPDNYKAEFKPNVSIKSKISFNYKFISFSIGYIPKFIPGNDDDDEKGKTDGFGFNLNLVFNHWLQGYTYSKVKGYYLANTKDFVPDWQEGDPYSSFPYVEVISFKGSTGYKFNPNFSLRAISAQTEIQLQSTGSFIPGLLYNYYNVENRNKNDQQTSSQNSKSFEILLDLAYYYTLVIRRNWYASIGVSPSFGMNYTNLLTRLPEGKVRTKEYDPIYRLNGHMGLGYNSKSFFGGAEIKGYESIRNASDGIMTHQSNNFGYQIFIGYRFPPPRILKKSVNKIEGLIPF